MKENYPNVRQSILILFIILILEMVLGALGTIVLTIFRVEVDSMVFLGVGNTVVIGGFILYSLKLKKCNFNIAYPIKKIPIVYFIPISLAMIGLSIITSEFDNLLRLILPIPEHLASIFRPEVYSGSHIMSAIFTLSVVAPLTEELLFRGFFLQSYLNQRSKAQSIIISSLLFASFHLNPWQFTGAFVCGVIFSIWFVEFKSLLPCLIGHAIFNIFPIITIRILKMEIPGYSSGGSKVVFQPLVFDLLGFFLLITSFIIFVIYKKQKRWPLKT